MKYLLFLFLLLGSLNSYAVIDKGNGGSASESQIVALQAQLETVALKIRSFFLKNEAALKSTFPEVDIQELAKKIKTSDIRIVDQDELLDKDGISRTCLNSPESSLIECKYSEIGPLLNHPATLFVLVFHEYLGLLKVEETSPRNVQAVDGYSISKKIAPYVSKVNDYDLSLTSPVQSFRVSGRCVPNTDSIVNNKYFWMEAGLKNHETTARTGLEVTEENINKGLIETAGSFMRKYSNDKPWFNEFFDPQGAQTFLKLRLAFLFQFRNVTEKYPGAVDNLGKEFMKRFTEISYCEVSELIDQHLK